MPRESKNNRQESSAKNASPGAQALPARDRLLAAADELFYAEGVQSVGVERILERAGVAKASLYNLYGSKDGLVLAYLRGRHDGTTEQLMAAVDRHRDPRRRILAVFDAQSQNFAQPGFRGCAFVSAFAEAPLTGQVAQAATEFRVLGAGPLHETVRRGRRRRRPGTIQTTEHHL